MADDIREGEPERARRKREEYPEDEEDRPRKRRPIRDDDDDEAFDRKRRNIARDPGDDLANSPVGVVVPLGVSIYALASLYLSLISCVVPGLGLVAIVCGVLALKWQKHSGTYAGVSGKIRAALGILFGVITTGLHVFLLVLALMNRR